MEEHKKEEQPLSQPIHDQIVEGHHPSEPVPVQPPQVQPYQDQPNPGQGYPSQPYQGQFYAGQPPNQPYQDQGHEGHPPNNLYQGQPPNPPDQGQPPNQLYQGQYYGMAQPPYQPYQGQVYDGQQPSQLYESQPPNATGQAYYNPQAYPGQYYGQAPQGHMYYAQPPPAYGQLQPGQPTTMIVSNLGMVPQQSGPLTSPPPSYRLWSITSIIGGFFFNWIGMCLGIAAMMSSNSVDSCSRFGDAVGARRNSTSALHMNIAALLFNIGGLVGWIVLIWYIMQLLSFGRNTSSTFFYYG